MRFRATVELIVCWFAWSYPFIFRAPHHQKRESITAPLLMQAGLLLEGVGIFIAWAFRLPATGGPGVGRMVGSMIWVGSAPVPSGARSSTWADSSGFGPASMPITSSFAPVRTPWCATPFTHR